MTLQTRCHYEVLGVTRDADVSTIKKAHRKLALLHHPDKILAKSTEEQQRSVSEFKLIQVAYECLSDPAERKWYDEHRDLILNGGIDGSELDGCNGSSFVFDVMPYQCAGCYNGYSDGEPDGFYSIYDYVFQKIFQGEKDGYLSEGHVDFLEMPNAHLSEVKLGDSSSTLADVTSFYSAWESFSTCLSYAWVDIYHLSDIREAPNRRIRRLMEDDNRKMRKNAKRERVEDVCALVRFVKNRDPRQRVLREKAEQERNHMEKLKKRETAKRKEEIAAEKEQWMAKAEVIMAEQEAADLNAGRIRLADLDSDDEFGGGGTGNRKRKGSRKKKNKGSNLVVDDNDGANVELAQDKHGSANCYHDGIIDGELPFEKSSSKEFLNERNMTENSVDRDYYSISVDTNDNGMQSHEVTTINCEESEEEPDSWRCECCRKSFKSEKQFDNHIKSKKHKESLIKLETKLRKEAEEAALIDMINELEGVSFESST